MVNYIVIMECFARKGSSEGKDGMARHGRKRKIWPLLLAALVLFALWENRSIQTEDFTFASARLPEGLAGLRIVQLSDLHGAEFGQDNARLLAAVERAEPDLILVTGDLVDEDTAEPAAYAGRVGAALTAIAPTYFVTGNHEWALGTAGAESVKQALRLSGVTVLSNEAVELTLTGPSGGEGKMVLAGVDDPNAYADQKTPEELAAEVYADWGDPFWLLLAHRNNRFDGGYCRFGADLTLCGHAHGGIWRLPGTDGLIDTHQQWFPSFTSGFYPCTDGGHPASWVFVSRGLGNSPRWALRLFNRPQVAVITLEKDNAT